MNKKEFLKSASSEFGSVLRISRRPPPPLWRSVPLNPTPRPSRHVPVSRLLQGFGPGTNHSAHGSYPSFPGLSPCTHPCCVILNGARLGPRDRSAIKGQRPDAGGLRPLGEAEGPASRDLRPPRTIDAPSSARPCSCAYSGSTIAIPRSATAEWLFQQPGSPQTGLRLWGGSKSHPARRRKGHVNCGTALGWDTTNPFAPLSSPPPPPRPTCPASSANPAASLALSSPQSPNRTRQTHPNPLPSPSLTHSLTFLPNFAD